MVKKLILMSCLSVLGASPVIAGSTSQLFDVVVQGIKSSDMTAWLRWVRSAGYDEQRIGMALHYPGTMMHLKSALEDSIEPEAWQKLYLEHFYNASTSEKSLFFMTALSDSSMNLNWLYDLLKDPVAVAEKLGVNFNQRRIKSDIVNSIMTLDKQNPNTHVLRHITAFIFSKDINLAHTIDLIPASPFFDQLDYSLELLTSSRFSAEDFAKQQSRDPRKVLDRLRSFAMGGTNWTGFNNISIMNWIKISDTLDGTETTTTMFRWMISSAMDQCAFKAKEACGATFALKGHSFLSAMIAYANDAGPDVINRFFP